MANGLEYDPGREVVDTTNEYALQQGENLPNHTASLAGRGKFVKIGLAKPVIFRTRQEAYRFCGWALSLAEMLPNEDGSHSFEDVREAIERS